MLVGAFEIKISAVFQIVPAFETEGVGTNPIKPDIENIRDLAPAVIIVRQEVFERRFKPAINAHFFDGGEDTRIDSVGVVALCVKRRPFGPQSR